MNNFKLARDQRVKIARQKERKVRTRVREREKEQEREREREPKTEKIYVLRIEPSDNCNVIFVSRKPGLRYQFMKEGGGESPG